MAMRRLGLTVKHVLPLLLATVVVAWLLDYLELGAFLAALITGFVPVFQYGLDKYRQLPPDPRPAPEVKRRKPPRLPFPFRRLGWFLAIIALLLVGMWGYWAWKL